MKKLSREFILKTIKDGEMPAVKCNSSQAAADYARAFYSDNIEIYESTFIILLNRANNTIGWAKILQGGTAGTVVDVKIVCKYAIDALASGVIFVHNHPSGNLTPSTQDDTLTRKLKDALAICDVRLYDSIVLTPNGTYYSYNDNGKL